MKDRIIFYLPTALKISLLDEAATQGIASISILLEKICDAYLQRKPMVAESTQKQEADALKMDILRATKRIKEADAKIKEKIAIHYETFGVPPSPQAKQAIIAGSTQTQSTKPNDLDITRFLKGTFEDKMGWWHAMCNRCTYTTHTGRDFESAAIRDLESHILQSHKEAWQ